MTQTNRLLAVMACAVLVGTQHVRADRALGMDVSDWEGSQDNTSINWTAVANSGIKFAFIRSTRGGTTGTYNENAATGTLANRYDDKDFVFNINTATSKGILAGPYHFMRADIVTYTNNGTTVTHTGTDEANHMLEIAGPYMKPGYLRPVLDLEAGSARSKTSLTDFAMDFINRIYAVKGIVPLVYASESYAVDEVDSRINLTDLWLARWDGPANIQTGNPSAASGYPNQYGVWNPSYPNTPTPQPWKFWQYSSTGRNPGIVNGTAAVDLDVANGDVEFVKDFLVPAVWLSDSDGVWSTASNWNASPNIPTANDRVVINRSTSNPIVTISGGAQVARSLQLNEQLNHTGGSLTITQYANLDGNLTVAGGAFSAASINNTATLTLSSGSITTPGALAGTGTTTVTGGTLSVGSFTQNLTISGGIAGLNSSATSVTKALSVTGSGKVDLGNGKVVFDYPVFTPFSLIRNSVISAYDNGTWAGPGIGSSQIVPGVGPPMGVAYAEANKLFTTFPATWNGATIDNSAVLLRATLLGDIDLDADVDFNDLLVFARSYGAANTVWTGGDFTYDGTTDFNDLVLLAQNYGQSTTGTFAGDWALAQSLSPEPSALFLGACLALISARRRRAN